MMLFGLSILYIFAVFKSSSEPIIKDGSIVPISCNKDETDLSVSEINGFFPNWRKDYIYPLKVCAAVKGGKVGSCERSKDSKLELVMAGPGRELSVPINPDTFTASNKHCYVFKASEIADKLKKDKLKWGLSLHPIAFLYGTQEPNNEATVQVSANVAPYYFNEPGSIVAAGGDYMLHAVICNFANCIVTVEGMYKITATEYFRKEKEYYPKYVGMAGPVTDTTISVTSIECKILGCPTKFIANYVATEEPPQMPPKAPPTPSEALEISLKTPGTPTKTADTATDDTYMADTKTDTKTDATYMADTKTDTKTDATYMADKKTDATYVADTETDTETDATDMAAEAAQKKATTKSSRAVADSSDLYPILIGTANINSTVFVLEK